MNDVDASDVSSKILAETQGLDASQISNPGLYEQYISAAKAPLFSAMAESRTGLLERIAKLAEDENPSLEKLEVVKEAIEVVGAGIT